MSVSDKNKNGIPDLLEKNPSARPAYTPNKPTFNPNMDVPAIRLPGFDQRGVQASEAYGWFKLVAAKSPKGSKPREFYDRWTAAMTRAGIPKNKWESVWKDAVDWTQTPGSGSNGQIEGYLGVLDPADYAPSGSTKKYGTTKSKTSVVTQYSPSKASADINRAIEGEVGRTATKAEIDAYIAGVNAQAKASPAVTEQTTTTAPGSGTGKNAILGSTTTKMTQTTGFDPTIYAQNFARSRPDFAESFATKSVLGIIQNLLRDPNAIGQVVE